MIKLELKQSLEREKTVLLEFARSRHKSATIVESHYKQINDREEEVRRALYSRMYHQQHIGSYRETSNDYHTFNLLA